jgi:hypothetical protein
MRTLLRLIISFVPAISFLQAVGATTLVRLTLDQLAAGADAVARVRCSRAESRWENGAVWTVTTADVLESMKGGLSGKIAIRVPGGRVQHLISRVDGTPKLKPGEEAVVFLEHSRAGGFTVAGWVEGDFHISRDPRTGAETVTQDSTAFAVFDATSRTFRAEGIRQMPLEEFRARVATAVARAAKKTR